MTFRKHRIFLSALSLLMLAATSAAQSPPVQARDRHFAKGTEDPAQDKIKEGLEMIRQKNYDGAIDSFKQAIYFARNQYNPEAYKYLGLCYRATRNYAKAIECFQKFFSQNTDPAPDVHIDMAEAYIELHDFEKARRELDLAGSEDDSRKDFHRQRFATAEMHEKMGDMNPRRRDAIGEYGEAAEFYQAAIDEKPLYSDAWMGLGRAQVKCEQWNNALKTYRTILEKGPMLHPDLFELYYNMGTCLLKRGDHQGALDHYHMALERDPDSCTAHLAIANILDSESHLSSALSEYQAALRCADKDNPARQAIMRKIDFIEQQLQPKDMPMPVRPSPQMRQGLGLEDTPPVPNNQPPPGKDAGF